MSIEGSLQIVGALGRGLGAPLLAQLAGEPFGPVVLAEPAPPAVAAAVRALGHPQIAAEAVIVRVGERRLAVSPWVAGDDLHAVLARLAAPLSPAAALAVVRAVAAVLADLHAAGVAHGRLGPDAIRIAGSGLVVLVGVRGGQPADDLAGLRSVLELLTGLDEVAPPPELASLLQAWPDDATALVAAIDASVPDAAGVTLSGLAPPPGPPTVTEHPLAGAVVGAGRSAAAPPKVRVAMIAGLTLALGVASGWFLAPGAPTPPELYVPGAAEVRLDCDPLVRSGERLPLDLPVTCRVTGVFPGRKIIEGQFEGALAGYHVCSLTAGVLECDGS